MEEGNLFSLQVVEEGQVYYLEAPRTARGPGADGTKLHKYDLKEREDKVILDSANGYELSHNKKKILYRSERSWSIVSSSGKDESGKGKLKTDAIQVLIDPRIEWNQMFNEAWRINRDYFYATNMHGTDWQAMREKYKVFLPHLASRRDLNRLIQWMCSE